MSDLRRTPLHPLQAELGARFVPFAGWEMPVQFTSVTAEHQAVRTAAGLFDVSHMGELVVEGAQALAGLEHALTNRIDVDVGRAVYTLMCTEEGGIVDDLIVYREGPERFLLVVNASRIGADTEHLRRVLAPYDCTLRDTSDATALLALQGPTALELLSGLTAADVGAMRPFSFVDAEVAGLSSVRIAATGYTGERGVELFVATADAPALWKALMEAGAPKGLQPCGLGARDTLRLEMKYPLYGQDLDLDHDPIEAGLGWAVKLQKGPFVGADRLRAVKEAGPARKLVGFRMRDRGIPRQGYELRVQDRPVGVVTSGTHSPSLGEPIGIGYVEAAHAAIGSTFDVIIRGRPVPAQVVETPFYRREGEAKR